MNRILALALALPLTACGGGGELPSDQPSAPVATAPAAPVVCQITINGVTKPCGS